MVLWIILFVIFMTVGVIICFNNEDGIDCDYCVIYTLVALFGSLLLSFVISVMAPNQYKPNEEILFSRTICENITITPDVSRNTTSDTDFYNIEYQIAGTKVTLSEQGKIYCTEFKVSDTGYSYIEKYLCEYYSPIRNFLYGSFGRPRWYYKIYLVPEDERP